MCTRVVCVCVKIRGCTNVSLWVWRLEVTSGIFFIFLSVLHLSVLRQDFSLNEELANFARPGGSWGPQLWGSRRELEPNSDQVRGALSWLSRVSGTSVERFPAPRMCNFLLYFHFLLPPLPGFTQQTWGFLSLLSSPPLHTLIIRARVCVSYFLFFLLPWSMRTQT